MCNTVIYIYIYCHYIPSPPGLGLEEVPDYDLDSEDEEWLNAQSNERVSLQQHFLL